jgi:hypothetical protein
MASPDINQSFSHRAALTPLHHHRGSGFMLYPYVSLAAITPEHLAGGQTARPASRQEILARQLRDNRTNAINIMAAQVLSPEAVHAEQTSISRRLASTTPSPMTTVRRGISRALMSAAERIGPEAA